MSMVSADTVTNLEACFGAFSSLVGAWWVLERWHGG
jgi:hypothetical protein